MPTLTPDEIELLVIRSGPLPDVTPAQVEELHPRERKVLAEGFGVGRRGGSVRGCPYRLVQNGRAGKIVGRTAKLWLLGHSMGVAELGRVRASYRRGLEQLSAGAPTVWA